MKANNAAAVRAVKAFQKRAEDNMDQTTRSVALTLFTAVVRRSPVDTGRFRGNWSVQVDQTPQIKEVDDKSGDATISKAQSDLVGKKAGDRIMLLNHLPYSIELENGHSDQAPRGMVKLTVTNFINYVNRAVQGLRAR